MSTGTALPSILRADRRTPFLRQEIDPGMLLFCRIMAVSFVLLELLVYFRWLPRWLDMRLSQADATAKLLGDHWPYAGAVWVAAAVGMFALTAWSATALLILWRRSRDLFGILLFVCFASAGVIGSTDVFEILRMQRSDAWAPFPALVMYVANAFCMLWVFVFPDGRLIPRWTAVFAAAWVAWNALRVMLSAADIAVIGHHAVAINFLLLASAVGSLVLRYHWYASDVERNQLKWLLLGCIFTLIVYGTISVIIAIPSLQQPGPSFLLRVGSTALMSLAMIAVPAVMLAAIFRQALLDVDRLINRTLLYAALTALTIAAFLLINRALHRIMELAIGQASELLAIVLALPLAIAVFPVRRRMSALLDKVLRERTVLTVMFVDIVESTNHAVRLGDKGWSDLLQAFRSIVRNELSSYGGEEIDTAGDGFFATFVGPGGAIHCAANIAREVQQLRISVRIGLHTGEVDRYGVDVSGVAVHVGARIMSLATANEVLLSAALKDLVAGSRIGVRDLGEHPLKGLPGLFRVYALSAQR